MNWPVVKLGDAVRFVGGGTPSKKNSEFWGGDIPWASVKDFKGSRLDQTVNYITLAGLENSASRLLPTGTVVIPTRMALGKAAITTRPIAINQDLKGVLPIMEIAPAYLLHYFQSQSEAIDRLGEGATVKGITIEKLSRLEIPLPPFDEQKRIAAVLDKADILRHQRQESLQLTEKLLQSVFIDMFVRNPEVSNWTSRSVEWMAKDAKGSMRTGSFGSQLLHSEFVDSGIAVLGIDNAVKNRFEWGQPRFITPEKYQGLKRYKVFPGDLLITIMGTLGRCAIVPEDIPESINTKHLCCITLDHQKCLPEFLHAAFLNHPELLRQLDVRTKGAVMPGLNMGIIKDLELRMPPIELQKKFKNLVALYLTSRADFEDSHEAAAKLFGSIQQRAFRGELDLSRLVLDPSADTPAVIAPAQPVTKPTKPIVSARFLQTPTALKPALKKLELTVRKGDPIPWSLDYFKYRILAAQPAPFSFEDLRAKAVVIFEDPLPYEAIRDLIFDLLGQDGKPALLRQRFDLVTNEATNEVSGRKEIVFEPVP